MKSYQYVVTNSPAIFFLFAIALIVWDTKRQQRQEDKLTRRATPKLRLKAHNRGRFDHEEL